jgi:hypothetical protein
MQKYNTEFEIKLQSHGSTPSHIRHGLGIADADLIITDSEIIKFNQDLTLGPQQFMIELFNKTDADPGQALEIVSVSFEGFTLDRFRWNSRYYPVYPEPWASEQTEPLPEYQSSATYLGWNGRWILYFDVPVFTWIHKLENLGWIYD